MIEYLNVNHYYAARYFVYSGKDQHFPGFIGKLSHVNFVLGNGAFRGRPDFRHPDDVFGFHIGESDFYKKPLPKPEPETDKGTGLKIVPNSVNDNKPKLDLEESVDANLSEYGYGFWARFLTAYPVRLFQGKNAPWYFMARMTSNKNYGNIGMNDRLLAIW